MSDYPTSCNKPWTTHKNMAGPNVRSRNRLSGLVLDVEKGKGRGN
jgi:hypothetical protein